jgi:GNAT superfamily N-acetyltransferase
MYTIKIVPKDELESIFPLVKLLNPDTEEKIQRNYECIGAYDNEKLIGISGIWILNKLYVGKHIEPDNVIIDPAYRGKGVGEKLIQWICDYGKTQGCIASELNCYLQNEKGIEFWKNQGYKILGYHFQKQL